MPRGRSERGSTVSPQEAENGGPSGGYGVFSNIETPYSRGLRGPYAGNEPVRTQSHLFVESIFNERAGLQPDRDDDRDVHPDVRTLGYGPAPVPGHEQQLASAIEGERDDSSTEPTRNPGRPLPAERIVGGPDDRQPRPEPGCGDQLRRQDREPVQRRVDGRGRGHQRQDPQGQAGRRYGDPDPEHRNHDQQPNRSQQGDQSELHTQREDAMILPPSTVTKYSTGECGEAGFSIVEFLISTVILLGICASVFTMMGDTQRTSSYQTEVQATLENTRIAMDTVERYIRQAGNDPKTIGFAGVTVTSTTQIRFRSDLTGSAVGNSDKGDPDGDTNDAGEDVTIQYNASSRSIEVVPNGGSAQPIANYISAFTMECYDSAGAITTTGSNVKKIRVSITGSTTLPDPKTGQTFSLQVASDVQLATRQ